MTFDEMTGFLQNNCGWFKKLDDLRMHYYMTQQQYKGRRGNREFMMACVSACDEIENETFEKILIALARTTDVQIEDFLCTQFVGAR